MLTLPFFWYLSLQKNSIANCDYASEHVLKALHPFKKSCLVIRNKSRKNSIFFSGVFQMVVKTFMDMDQDSEDEKQQYLPLALHLASEFFLRNPNKDVRLLVACCLADIFRIYAPEAPYTSHDKLKVKMPQKIKAFLLPYSYWRKYKLPPSKIQTKPKQTKQSPPQQKTPKTNRKMFLFPCILIFRFIKEELL